MTVPVLLDGTSLSRPTGGSPWNLSTAHYESMPDSDSPEGNDANLGVDPASLCLRVTT